MKSQSAEISEAIADGGGMVFNINLPAWRSTAPSTPEPEKQNFFQDPKNRSVLIGAGALLVLILLIVFLPKRKK